MARARGPVVAALLLLIVVAVAMWSLSERRPSIAPSIDTQPATAHATLVADAEIAPESARAIETADPVGDAARESAAPRDGPPAPTSAPFTGAFVVRLEFPDGAPAAGADVELCGVVDGDLESQLERWSELHPAEGREHLRLGRLEFELDEPLLERTADDAGRVHLPWPAPGSRVRALSVRDGRMHAGQLFLGNDVMQSTAPEHALVLAPSDAVRVRVVDAQGSPAAGVPVAVVAPLQHVEQRFAVLAGAHTGPDGAVVLEDRLANWPAWAEHGRPPRVRVLAVIDPPLETELADVASGEVLLQLPPLATVLVELPESRGASAAIELAVADRDDAFGVVARVVDGRATFPHVGVGLRLRARLVEPASPAVERFDGPSSAAERLVHLWQSGLPFGAWRVTLVDEAGAPLAGRAVIAAQPEGVPRIARTDSAGTFRYAPYAATPFGTRLRLRCLDEARVGGRRRTREVELAIPARNARASADELDLGRIVLPLVEVLASGTVRDGAGAPIADALVRAHGTPSASSTDAHGRFLLVGASPSTALELIASARGYDVAPPVAVTAPAMDVELVLHAGASVRIAVQLDPAVDRRAGVRVEASRDGERRDLQRRDPPGEFDVLSDDDALQQPAGEHRFLIDGLPPGPWDIAVVSATSGQRLWSRSIELGAEPVDLGSIDLRDVLPTFELTVHAGGTHEQGFRVRFLDATPAMEGSLTLSSPVRLARPPPGARIEVLARLHPPVTQAVDAEHVEVRLGGARWLTLRLPDGYPVPPGDSPLRLVLQDAAGRAVSTRSLTPDNTYSIALAGPGRFSVELLERAGAPSSLARCEVDVTEAHLSRGEVVELPLALDAWTRAIEAWAR